MNPGSGRALEIDVYLPELDLCFEFQDEYHYMPKWYFHNPIDYVKQRDNIYLIKREGKFVIVVPCWWDGASTSLAAIVSFERPDFARLTGSLLHELLTPLNPSSNFFSDTGIPDLGELMLASFFPHLTVPDSLFVDSAWWIGEKYDGVRVCWNATQKTLYHKCARSGITVPLPSAIASCLFTSHATNRLARFLDGEAWCGRGGYDEVYRVLPLDDLPLWSFLRFVIFDAPSAETVSMRWQYETRYQLLLLACVDPDMPFMVPASRLLCSMPLTMYLMLESVTGDNGEGIMLRLPGSLYERGRSNALWKLKATKGDQEALVVSADERGCILEMPNGVTFGISANEILSPNALQRGDVVTFSYEYFRGQTPVSPSFVRLRRDLLWESVVAGYYKYLPRHHSSTNVPATQQPLTVQVVEGSAQHNTKQEIQKRNHKGDRHDLEEYATTIGLEPLSPDTWYTVFSEFSQKMASKSLLAGFTSWTFTNALFRAFPDIEFDKSKFHSGGYWTDLRNRRTFFCAVARKEEFDPLVPSNWYSLDPHAYRNIQGGQSMMAHYGGNYVEALLHAFPEIGLERHHFYRLKLHKLPRNHHTRFPQLRLEHVNTNISRNVSRNNSSGGGGTSTKLGKNSTRVLHRRVLENFAAQHHFDPRVSANWIAVQPHIFLKFKGARAVLQTYSSIGKAIIRLFPEVHFDLTQFPTPKERSNFWVQKHNQKTFFVNFAREKGFDPQVSENWYGIALKTMFKHKGASSVMACYGGSLAKALVCLFPNIGLVPSKFAA